MMWGMIALAIVWRVAQFLANRSLWYDEVLLALNIRMRDFVGLTLPLDHHQGAPLGFLWGVKTSVMLFGESELSLRLVAFLAGCLSVVIFWRVARRLFSHAAPLAVLLFATSAPLIYYASEVKQYGLDVFFAITILWGALRLQEASFSGRAWWQMGVLGVVAVWCSHPSLFVLAGVGVALLWQAYLHNHQSFWRVLGMCATWATSFLMVWGLFYRPLSQSSHLQAFWAGGFWQLHNPLSWVAVAFEPFFMVANEGQFALAGVAFVCFWVGVWRTPRQTLYVLLLPIVFTLGASALQQYPFRERLILFLTPFVMLLVAEGVITLLKPFLVANVWLKRGVWAFLAIILVGRTPLLQDNMAGRDAIASLMNEPIAVYGDIFLYEIGAYYGFSIQPADALEALETPVWVVYASKNHFDRFTRPLLTRLYMLGTITEERRWAGVIAQRLVPLPQSP